MAGELRECPYCGAKGSVEAVLRIDLDDVVLEDNAGASTDHWAKWRVKDFIPAASANDPDNGLVFEEARIGCRVCGEELGDVDFPWRFSDRWKYTP